MWQTTANFASSLTRLDISHSEVSKRTPVFTRRRGEKSPLWGLKHYPNVIFIAINDLLHFLCIPYLETCKGAKLKEKEMGGNPSSGPPNEKIKIKAGITKALLPSSKL